MTEVTVPAAAIPRPVVVQSITAALNVTATDAATAGFVTVGSCGAEPPLFSNLNVEPGTTKANLVMAAVSVDGTVCVYTQSAMHLIVDLEGYYPQAAAFARPTSGDHSIAGIPPLHPRLLDTRPGSMVGYSGPKPAAGTTVAVTVTGGPFFIPVPSNAAAVAMNVTGTGATAPGFVTVWPCGEPRPEASNLNLFPGGTTANLVISRVGVSGQVCLYAQSGAHLIADLEGWYSFSATYVGLRAQRRLDTRPESMVGYQGRSRPQG